MRKLESVFEPRRFAQLLKLSHYGYARGFMLAGLLVGAAYLGFGVLAGLAGFPMGHGAFINIAFMAGILLSSRIFSDLHHSERGAYALMLPGSQEEKFLAAFLVSAVAFPLFTVLVMTAASLVIGTAGSMAHGLAFTVFNPFTAELGSTFHKYIVCQALFFAGSVWFGRYGLFKTIFVLWLFSIAVLAVFLVSLKVFVIGDMQNLGAVFGGMSGPEFGRMITGGNPVAPYAKAVFGVLVPLLMYVAAYFRMREMEIKG